LQKVTKRIENQLKIGKETEVQDPFSTMNILKLFSELYTYTLWGSHAINIKFRHEKDVKTVVLRINLHLDPSDKPRRRHKNLALNEF
jgi:hypothetical protein